MIYDLTVSGLLFSMKEHNNVASVVVEGRPIIPAAWQLRQEGHKCKPSLGYRASSRSA